MWILNIKRLQRMKHTAFLSLMGLLAINIILSPKSLAGDYVIILHGIARSSQHMDKLAIHLKTQDYDVINLDYPSTHYNLEQLTEIIHQHISKKLTEDKPIHFVGYSMGGLIVRSIINKHRPKNLGRVVQLATPNNGSEVADFLKENWLYKKIYGPAGQQLVTNQEQIGTLLGEVDYELGVIAGNSTIDPVSSITIPSDDDGKVSVASTRLDGMQDHIVINASHTFFPNNKIAQQQTGYFLRHGVFRKNYPE